MPFKTVLIVLPSGCPAEGAVPGSSWFGCGERDHEVGWSGPGHRLSPNWTLSSSESSGAWHWGQVKVYGGGGFVQELITNMDVSRALIQHLRTHQWLDPLTRALFVEFSLYNTNSNLLAVLTFLLEFPVSERVQSSLDLKVCRLHHLSQGLDLPLLLTVTTHISWLHTKSLAAFLHQSPNTCHFFTPII